MKLNVTTSVVSGSTIHLAELIERGVPTNNALLASIIQSVGHFPLIALVEYQVRRTVMASNDNRVLRCKEERDEGQRTGFDDLQCICWACCY